jgi:hypothetical protein
MKPSDIPTEEVLEELNKEIGFRQAVYGKKVANDTMHQHEMDRKIACIQRAIELIQEHAPMEGDMFDGLD